MKRFAILMGLLLLILPAEAGKNLSNTPACKAEYQAFGEAQQALSSVSDSLGKCAVSGDVNYDCAQNYEAVERCYQNFQTVLTTRLRPCLNPLLKKQPTKPSSKSRRR